MVLTVHGTEGVRSDARQRRLLLFVVGVLALYGRAAVLDEHAFADRATAALAQDEVQDEVGTRIADRAIGLSRTLAPAAARR